MSYGIYGEAFWWQAEEDAHSAISKFISVLREEQDSYYRDLATYAGLFNGKPPHSRYAHGSSPYSIMNQPRLQYRSLYLSGSYGKNCKAPSCCQLSYRRWLLFQEA